MAAAHYVFVAGDIYADDRLVSAREILTALLQRNIWLIWDRTPYQRDYRPGDRVLFYLARSGKCQFVGAAELAGEPEPATDDEIAMAESLGLIGYDRKLELRNVQQFPDGIPIRPLISDLAFIKNKHWWGHSFRQGALRIPQQDFVRVLRERDQA